MRNRLAVSAAIAGLALLTWIRIAVIDHLSDQGFFSKYLVLAQSLPRERLSEVSPLYLWMMVLLRGIGMHGIRTMQIVAVSVAALLVAIAANRLAGPIAAVAAAIFILGSRAALVCATDLEPETLILLLNAASLAAFAHRRWFTGGILLGLSATARPVALLAAIAIGAWLMRRELRSALRFAIAVALPAVAAIALNFALTGEAILMDPGSVFYEGMNPAATGYEGVQPRIVNDLEAQSPEPDYLHVAYRIIASRATGRALDHRQTNVYWTSKATAFMRRYPLAALRLTARKFLFAIQSYDAWDLATMQRKAQLLGRFPLWIPFGMMLTIACMALRRTDDGRALPLIFTVASALTLIIFYVTARQREAILPALAIAAGIGVTHLVSIKRVLAVLAISILLTINGHAQREDLYGWDASTGDDVQRAFDRALALENRGEWSAADAILARLQELDYHPMRENRATPSVAHYRALAALRTNRDPRPQLAIAMREAPGDLHVLAMAAALGDRGALEALFAIHDPFSARAALAQMSRGTLLAPPHAGHGVV